VQGAKINIKKESKERKEMKIKEMDEQRKIKEKTEAQKKLTRTGQ